MSHTPIPPCIGAGDYEVVIFILIGLVWLIANLAKKASEASKTRGATPGRPRPRIRVEGESDSEPQTRSLSGFLRRLQEMAEQQAGPQPPRQPRVEEPRAGTFVPTPPPPRRPVPPEGRMPRRAPVREPTLRRAERRWKPPEPKPTPGPGLSADILPTTITPTVGAAAAPPPVSETGAYVIREPAPRRVTELLGTPISAPGMKKGIILAEILGRPKALRRRRAPLPPR